MSACFLLMGIITFTLRALSLAKLPIPFDFLRALGAFSMFTIHRGENKASRVAMTLTEDTIQIDVKQMTAELGQ